MNRDQDYAWWFLPDCSFKITAKDEAVEQSRYRYEYMKYDALLMALLFEGISEEFEELLAIIVVGIHFWVKTAMSIFLVKCNGRSSKTN